MQNKDTLQQKFQIAFNRLRDDDSNFKDTRQRAYPELSRLVMENTVSFIKSCAWCNTKVARDLVLYYDKSAADVAVILGKTDSCIRSQRSQLCNRITSYIGEDFFSILFKENGHTGEDLYELDLRIKALQGGVFDINTYFLPDIQRSVFITVSKNKKIYTYDLDECGKELSFIATYGKKAIEGKLKSLNPRKLSYIINILSQKDVVPSKESNTGVKSAYVLNERKLEVKNVLEELTEDIGDVEERESTRARTDDDLEEIDLDDFFKQGV